MPAEEKLISLTDPNGNKEIIVNIDHITKTEVFDTSKYTTVTTFWTDLQIASSSQFQVTETPDQIDAMINALNFYDEHPECDSEYMPEELSPQAIKFWTQIHVDVARHKRKIWIKKLLLSDNFYLLTITTIMAVALIYSMYTGGI